MKHIALLDTIFGAGKKAGKVRLLTIASPVSGRVVPLTTVPDEAFSGKMMGDGVAIVPSEGKLYSPVDGTVDTVADTFHAIGLHTPTGMDILVHVGLETVNLKGRHFACKVKEGDRVKTGDLLLEFDLDAIIREEYQVFTPVTLVNADEFDGVSPSGCDLVAKGDTLLVVKEK